MPAAEKFYISLQFSHFSFQVSMFSDIQWISFYQQQIIHITKATSSYT